MLAGEQQGTSITKRPPFGQEGQLVMKIVIEIRPALIVAVAVLLQHPPPIWVSLIVLLILVAHSRETR
jgi:hypothetical protein